MKPESLPKNCATLEFAMPQPRANGFTPAVTQRHYLDYLLQAVRAELQRNRALEQAVDKVPLPAGADWLLAGDNHAHNVTASFTELEWE